MPRRETRARTGSCRMRDDSKLRGKDLAKDDVLLEEREVGLV